MSLIDPSKATARDWFVMGIVLIALVWLYHEFVLKPRRVLDQICERAEVLEPNKFDSDTRLALEEIERMCESRNAIEL